MRRLVDIWKSYAERTRAADGTGLAARIETRSPLCPGRAGAPATLESVSRSLAGRSFYSSAEAVQHLVLWVALLGA